MNQSTNVTLQNILTEKDLCDLLGMTKSQASNLRRNKGLPYIKLGQRVRMYFENDIIEFFKENRVVLNRAETE